MGLDREQGAGSSLAEPQPGRDLQKPARSYSQERRQLCFQCVSSAVLPPSLLRAPHHHFYSTADNCLPYFLSLRTLCSRTARYLDRGLAQVPLKSCFSTLFLLFPCAKYSGGQRHIHSGLLGVERASKAPTFPSCAAELLAESSLSSGSDPLVKIQVPIISDSARSVTGALLVLHVFLLQMHHFPLVRLIFPTLPTATH